jgi:hypothetical protein
MVKGGPFKKNAGTQMNTDAHRLTQILWREKDLKAKAKWDADEDG